MPKNNPAVSVSSAASPVLSSSNKGNTYHNHQLFMDKGSVGVHSVMPIQTLHQCLQKSRIHGRAKSAFGKFVCFDPFLKKNCQTHNLLFHRKQVYPVVGCIYCRNTQSFSPWCYLKDETSKAKALAMQSPHCVTPVYQRERFPFLLKSHFGLRRVTLALNLQNFHILIIVLRVISVRATSTDSNHFNGRLPRWERSSGGGGSGDRLTFLPRCGGSAWEEVDGMKGSRCLIKALTLFAET